MKPDPITLMKPTETIRDILSATPPKSIQYENRMPAWRNDIADSGITKNPETRPALSGFTA